MTPIFSIALTIAVALSAFLVFQLIYNLRRQKKTDRLLLAFDEAASEFGLSISKREVLGDRIIGLDELHNKLLYLQRTGYKEDGYLVDLEEIRSCRVNKTYTPFWNGRVKVGVSVQTLALQFTYKNGAKPLLLPFYRNTVDPVFELQEKTAQAEAWQQLLSGRVNVPPIESFLSHSLYGTGALSRLAPKLQLSCIQL